MKYRIWNKISKCFVSEYENTAGENRLKHFITADGEIGKIIYPLDEICEFEDNIINQDDYVVQRFIEMFDKHNKMIYEGDIVKVKCYDNWDDEGYDAIYEVRWCHIQCGFRGFTKGMIELNYSGRGLNSQDTEVIGNVFENPYITY